MRNSKFYVAAFFVLAGLGQAVASSAPGFEAIYADNYSACVTPSGTVADCGLAIQKHIDALLAGNVSVEIANDVFSGLRAEVFVANEPDEDFRALIDALFEQLLPDSGSIGAPVQGAGLDSITDLGNEGGNESSPQ